MCEIWKNTQGKINYQRPSDKPQWENLSVKLSQKIIDYASITMIYRVKLHITPHASMRYEESF